MPLASLPSKYGIGTMGEEAKNFVDFLYDTEQYYWQVLPLNPTSYGDSPYQSPSAFAGSPYYIDLPTLAKQGLITEEELKNAEHDTERIDYGYMFNDRIALLRKAFSRFDANGYDYACFKTDQGTWLKEYSVFMALKVKHGYASWDNWQDKYKFRKDYDSIILETKDESEFWSFLQYEFYTQWLALKKYANRKGIEIIGDMPIYVAYDSVEVWSNPSAFLLDENLNPTIVAGCPPDGFAPDGQLWGNPIYDWAKMKADGYTWWIERVKRATILFDIVRIDHFRGFEAYYGIPFGDATARNGKWYKCVGAEPFEAINKALDHPRIIAEDLGQIDDDVKAVLAKTGYPGMKVLQFAFFEDDNEYLPRTYATDNCVVYTGTHDSYTTEQWAEDLEKGGAVEKRFLKECKKSPKESYTDAMIRLALGSIAKYVIIPLGDYMNLGKEARINEPSTLGGNWDWRVQADYDTIALRKKITRLTAKSGR